MRKNTSGLSILLRCYGYLRPYLQYSTSALALVFLINGMTLVQPQILRMIIDRGIRQSNDAFLSAAVLGLLILVLVKGLFTFLQGRFVEISSQGVAYTLRRQIHERLTALSFSFHDRAQSGQILSRAIQDVDRIRFLTGRASLRLLEGALLLVGTAVTLVLMSPSLAMLAIVTLPLVVWRTVKFGLLVRPLSLRIQDQLAVLTTRLEQNLRGARIVKAFSQEEAEIARFTGENRNWFGLSARLARIQAVQGPMLTLIADLSVVIIMWFGGLLIMRGRLTYGELVAYTTYMAQLAHPVRMVGMLAPVVGMAVASGQRIFEIIDTQSDVRVEPGLPDLPSVEGWLRFEHVSFEYAGRSRALHEVSFDAPPGSVIAFLGASGSGKSTLINLIPRFYDITSGAITIDGHDIRSVNLESLRRQIGIVLQETTLFATTIKENIAFGVPQASDESICAAARAAQAHGFISSMPQGYETIVGERGLTLSGGQKQRIAIARALLKNPRILLLDDATSSVDAETEGLIQTALATLMAGRTSLIIAQRLSTVRLADRVIVLERGRVAAEGTHAELLETSRLYAAIYRRQLRPQERGMDR